MCNYQKLFRIYKKNCIQKIFYFLKSIKKTIIFPPNYQRICPKVDFVFTEIAKISSKFLFRVSQNFAKFEQNFAKHEIETFAKKFHEIDETKIFAATLLYRDMHC